MPRKTSFQVYIDAELHEQIKAAAAGQRFSVSELARTLLERWLREQGKKSA